jgi:hypothetical protein
LFRTRMPVLHRQDLLRRKLFSLVGKGRHTKKADLLQRSRHSIRVPSTPSHAPPSNPARPSGASRAHQNNRSLHVLSINSRATHARKRLGILVRVRVDRYSWFLETSAGSGHK